MWDKDIQNNKLQILGRLTASLIHEIRNPLSAIRLNLDYMDMLENELTPETKNCVGTANEAMKRLQFIIDNIYDFSKKGMENGDSCSLNDITEQSIAIATGNARTLGIEIEKKLQNNIPRLAINKNKILQVFLNLITNAMESCENGGKVVIKTYKNKDGEIIWEVKDNGCGISDKDKEKIFNDFYTSKHEGTGLGLSVCNMILKEYKTELNFDSKLGHGSKFYIKFLPFLIKGG